MSKIGNQGFVRTAWKYFTKIRHARQNVKEQIVGTDSVGNKYILKHGDKEAGIKETRLVLPSEETAVMYTERLGMHVPQEWDAWLRFRRDNPPTLEKSRKTFVMEKLDQTVNELEMNKLKKLKMQQRVRELEMKERLEKGEDIKEFDDDSKANAVSTNITQDISGDTTKSPFPTYDDLERVPGEFHNRPKE